MNFLVAGADFSCVFVLLIILISVTHLNKHEKKYTYYTASVVLLMIFCLCDSIAFFMDEAGGNYALHFYSNMLSYAGADIVLVPFAYYITEEIREFTSISKVHARLTLLLCTADFFIMCIGAYTGTLFRITDDGITFGPLSGFVGVIQLLVSIYYIVLIFRLRNFIERTFFITLELYFGLPIGFISLEIALGFECMYLVTTIVMMIVYVAVVQKDLQTTAVSEKIMRKASVTDNLTGIFNRRAYSESIAKLSNPYPEDFVYMSLDVNGLKTVNDTLGHAAGDEIIVAAAECMTKCLGTYGDVFRIGGDEFAAIFYAPKEQLPKIIRNFQNEVDCWKGKIADFLSISLGYVTAEEAEDTPISGVALLADRRMYEAKAAFYRAKGVDRRGQIEAHTALCTLYTKTLRINITSDTFQPINVDPSEQTADKGYADTISGWLEGFGRSGQVHPDDLEDYLARTDLDYMRSYFRRGKTSLSIQYRRKYDTVYKKVMMEIIPTNAYTDTNQDLFLYVKDIDI